MFSSPAPFCSCIFRQSSKWACLVITLNVMIFAKALKEMYNLILWKQTCLRGLVSRNNDLGKQKAEQEGERLL